MYPVIIAVAAAAAVTTVCAIELTGGRFRRLASSRRGEAFPDFEGHFRGAGVHADVLLAVHLFFQQWTAVRGLPAHASDDLRELYGLDDTDVQDAVAVVAASAHCLTPAAITPEMCAELRTVEDLVHAVNRMHRAVHAQTPRPPRKTAS